MGIGVSCVVCIHGMHGLNCKRAYSSRYHPGVLLAEQLQQYWNLPLLIGLSQRPQITPVIGILRKRGTFMLDQLLPDLAQGLACTVQRRFGCSFRGCQESGGLGGRIPQHIAENPGGRCGGERWASSA